MKKQQGFTLIELIIVIVILGILAVTAAPKFLNIQADANASTLQGVKGSIDSAMRIINGKSIIVGSQKIDKAATQAPADIEGVAISFGYPAATAAGLVKALVISVDATGANLADFNFVADATADPDEAYIYANGTESPIAVAPATAGTCYVKYTEASATTVALVEVVTTGC